jgi:hypothetical protein
MRTALLLLLASPALAQDQAIQRELIQRQQQSEQFNLQLRQSIEASKVPPGDAARRMEVETRQLGERQRLENVSERQLREVKPDTPQELRPQERSQAERERQTIPVPASCEASRGCFRTELSD